MAFRTIVASKSFFVLSIGTICNTGSHHDFLVVDLGGVVGIRTTGRTFVIRRPSASETAIRT